MRFGIVVPVGSAAELEGGPLAVVADAEEAGMDLVWLESEPAAPDTVADALTAAAYVAPATHGLRLAVRAPAGPHPVHIAEQAAVSDNVSNGRLILALDGGDDPAAPLTETAEVVLAATGPRPFAHDGERWRIPGHVAGNQAEERITVTPKPAQLRLPVWLCGVDAGRVGPALGLSHVVAASDSTEVAAAAWEHARSVLGRAAGGLLRPALRNVDCAPSGDFDDDLLTRSLHAESVSWGLDVAVLRLPPSLDHAARRRAVRRVATLVAPALRMDSVPAHVLAYWKRERAGRLCQT